MKQFTFNQLNKKAAEVPVTIVYDNTFYTLDYFASLEKGEDYYDPEDEVYQYDDGTPCNIVAYVKEMPEHIPLLYITKIYVVEEAKIR